MAAFSIGQQSQSDTGVTDSLVAFASLLLARQLILLLDLGHEVSFCKQKSTRTIHLVHGFYLCRYIVILRFKDMIRTVDKIVLQWNLRFCVTISLEATEEQD